MKNWEIASSFNSSSVLFLIWSFLKITGLKTGMVCFEFLKILEL
jgi:hypothetical protein